MKIPLLLNANPRITREGPKVLLHQGSWNFECDAKDTEWGIALTSKLIDAPGIAQVIIRKAGSESSITVYACQSQ